MEDSERKVLEDLLRNAEEAHSLFSGAGQERQERTAVAGLLRVLQVEFREEEIIKQGPEPIDVVFRDARFQVSEILDRGRPRNREIEERADRIRRARRLQDLVEPGVISSRPLSPDELLALVVARASEKARKYGETCAEIDLLLYVNLMKRHLYPLGPLPATIPNELIRWRSVSVVMEPVALVLWAAGTAPVFLRSHSGQVVRWPGLDSIFPRLGAG